ncbi:MAG: T9SS type A sorting domain-containing protein [Bacteroidia bacterium]|nr:T9SS type A sorting domain-containing protein [Bacteroidia bacterium]MCZ2277298.1 T9SS type A sorting domain-containing protein [Bacteroidia bacterium]
MRAILTLTTFLTSGFTLLTAQSVIVGTGTSISVFSPINRTYDYCVFEAIYPANQINMAGSITSIGFQRHDGINTDSIQDVTIYMKHSTNLVLAAGTFDTSGYIRLFNGLWPNDAGTGWRERQLDVPFSYDGVSNLQVLLVKGYEPAIANTPVAPRWLYTASSTGTPVRRYYGNSPISSATNLSTTNYVSNIRLQFGLSGVAEISNQAAQVFPNPSSGEVLFNFNPVTGMHTLTVQNSFGQVILTEQIQGHYTLMAGTLTSGMYFYRICNSANQLIKQGKLVIE